MAHKPFAVIDVGSNSGRVVVLAIRPGGHLEILADGRSPLRLARDVEASSVLSKEAIERTVSALRDFRAVSAGLGSGTTIALATAAIRESENGADLLARIRAESGLDVRIISGEEEARLGFLGAVYGLTTDNGILIDIGGGSVELTRFRSRRMTDAWSLPLGALRLSDHFLKSDPPTDDEVAGLTEHVRAALAEAGIPALEPDEQLLGTGGTIRNLGKIDRRSRAYPIQRLHGYVLTRRRAHELARLMTSKRLARRTSTPGLSRERADSIAGGALVAQTAMDVLGADEMVVSGQGMREGAVYESLGIEPPPGEEVRKASARALVSRFASWDEGRARRRADIALRILDSVDPSSTAKSRERLEQAAFVLDVGRSIDYYRRFEHTADILLTSDLGGFTHRKLALLAAVVRFAGDEGVSIRMYRPLLTAEDRPQVARLATILAFADDIEHRVPEGGEIPVTSEERRRTVVLTAPVFDPSRRLAMEQRFRRAFGRRLVVQPSEGDDVRE